MLNDNPRLKKKKKKICYLLAILKFEQQILEGNRTCLMWPKISLKLKDFPPKEKKKKKKKKEERVRVKKTNLLDVALREIEPVRCGPKSV